MRLPLILLALAATPLWAEPDTTEGRAVYFAHCAGCHGATGTGDGPLAELLTVPPADLTALAASNGGTFPTFRVVRQIDGRDPMLAHGGEMPLFGRLYAFPDSAIAAETGQPILTAQPIADVTAWLATIQE